jgi:hypothetical protein
MRLCTPFGDRRRWQHSVALDALGGRITLHWVAELIAFSKFSAGFPASPPIQSIVGNIPISTNFWRKQSPARCKHLAPDAPPAALPVHRNRVVGPARLARVTQVIEEEGGMLRAIERRLLNFVRLLQQIVSKHPQTVMPGAYPSERQAP